VDEIVGSSGNLRGRLPVSIQTHTLPDWLARSAENRPTQLALRSEQVRWSFAELEQRVTRMARQLATAGVKAGDRIALLAENGPLYVACIHALTRLGAILVPLNTRLTRDELCWQMRDVRATMLLHDMAFTSVAAEIGKVLPEVARAALDGTNDEIVVSRLPEADMSLRTLIDLDATQAIIYTSGTTGNPKGAIITYGMQWWSAVASALNLGYQRDDCWLACLPLFHIGGLSILMKSVIYGMSIIVHKKFDAPAINRSIVEDRVTMISVVSVMLQRILAALDQEGHDGSAGRYPASLRCVLLGGGPAPLPLLEDCARRAIPVVQTYGLTEACSQAVTLAPEDVLRKLGSAGRPLLPVQLRIMRDHVPVGPGEPGEIFLQGPTITPGYADRSEATAKAFHDGWFATGDLGYLDAEGYLYVLDRRADLIISGGENVYPAEIESVLLSHPDVEEAGVCGQEDAQWGQVPIAFVRLYAGSTVSEQALLDYLSHHLAHYKRPRSIHRVQQLPRNSSGKLLRRELLKLLL
jgi:O-succinylbenzoic acid--CoA ligase